MAQIDLPSIDVQRATLLDVLQALAAFGRERARRHASVSAETLQEQPQPIMADHDNQS